MVTQEKLSIALEQTRQNNWDKANELLAGFGIEYVSCANKDLKYINLGDTYDQTICQEINTVNQPLLFIGSWGDWYEETEREYCEVKNVVRCGYCSEFTPMNERNWQDVVCENCGNLVAG